MNTLLLCGDIESNPGPAEKELLLELLDGQRKILGTMEGMQKSQANIETKLAEVTARIDAVEQQLSSLNKMGEQVKNVENMLSHLESDLSALYRKVDDLENRSRRKNLIIYGVEESNNETPDELERKVKDEVIEQKLGLTVSGIERMHRLGRKSENKSRPVIIKFIDHREKTSILSAAYELKGTSKSIAEDFSKRVREQRKQLWESAKAEKDNGAKVKLIYDKLSVDSVIFAWDEVKGSRFKLGKRKLYPKAKVSTPIATNTEHELPKCN